MLMHSLKIRSRRSIKISPTIFKLSADTAAIQSDRMLFDLLDGAHTICQAGRTVEPPCYSAHKFGIYTTRFSFFFVSFDAPNETLDLTTAFCRVRTYLRGHWARISRPCKSKRDSLWRVDNGMRLLQVLLRLFSSIVQKLSLSMSSFSN